MGSFSELHRQLHLNSAKHYRQEDILPPAKLAQFGSLPLKDSYQSPYQPSYEPPHSLHQALHHSPQKLRVRYDHQPDQVQKPQPSPQRQKLQPLDPNKTLPSPRTSPFSLQRITQHFNIFKMVTAPKTKTVVYADEQTPPAENMVGDGWKHTPPATPNTPLVSKVTKSPAKRAPTPKARPTPRPPKPLTPAASTAPKPSKKRASDAFSTYSESSSGGSTPGSPRRSFSSPYSHVIKGRVAKNYKPRSSRRAISPSAVGSAAIVAAAAAAAAAPTVSNSASVKRFASSEVVDELVSELNRDSQMDEAQCVIDMQMEKSLYPGSDSWAVDEERLFEALFMRQYRPVLPESWTFYFRGIPAPDAIFACSPADAPLIYSCSGDHYQASRALVRLVQLTGTVRALVQSGVKTKAAATIRAELFRYANWAAKDGGFTQRAVIPTFLLEVVDTSLGGGAVTLYIQERMADLADQHREYLRRDPIEAASFGPNADPIERQFIRRPPVVFGLFIIHTMVLILTIDAAKPTDTDRVQVSYHVEVDFNSPYQGVWNALTVAIPVCMARDDIRRRMEDYPPIDDVSDSDPDA